MNDLIPGVCDVPVLYILSAKINSISTSAAQSGHRPGMNTFTGTSQVLFAGRLSGSAMFIAHQVKRMNPLL